MFVYPILLTKYKTMPGYGAGQRKKMGGEKRQVSITAAESLFPQILKYIQDKESSGLHFPSTF